MQASAYLIIVNVPISVWHGEISNSRQLIGRSAVAQLRIPSSFTAVSRRHAEIWVKNDGIWIRDVGSSVGTKVNGVRLKSQVPYQTHVGDRLTLGFVELEIVKSLPADDNNVLSELDSIAEKLLTDTDIILRERKTTEFPTGSLILRLSQAELEVVLWVSRGVTGFDDIGKKLFRSPHTVRTQLNSIYQKLGVHSRDELLGWLRRAHLFDE